MPVQQVAVREPARVNQAFVDYFAMGAGRSFEDLIAHYQTLSKPPTINIRTMRKWASAYHWEERIIESNERRMRVLEHKERLELEALRVKFSKETRSLIEKANKRLNEMMDWPLAETEKTITDEAGNKIKVVLRPVKWTMADMSTLWKTMDHAARLDLEMATSRTKVDVEVDMRTSIFAMAKNEGLSEEEAENAYQIAMRHAVQLKLDQKVIEHEPVLSLSAP